MRWLAQCAPEPESLSLTMRPFAWLIAATTSAVSLQASAADPPTAQQALLRFEQSTRRLSPVHIEAEEKIAERKNADGSTATSDSKVTVYRNDWRWKVKRDQHSATIRDGKPQSVDNRNDFVLGDQVLQAFLIDLIDGKPLVGPKALGNLVVQAWPGGQDEEHQIWHHLQSIRVLLARLPGDGNQPLWRVMSDASSVELLPEPEMIGTAKTFALKSRGKFGEHSVWLDPEHGYLPRKIEIRKCADDLFDSLSLDVLDGSRLMISGVANKPRPARPSRPPPPGGVKLRETKARTLTSWTIRIDDVKLERVSGVPVMTAFEQTTEYAFDDGTIELTRSRLQVRHLDFDARDWPANAFQLWIDIPDGYQVSVYQDASGKMDLTKQYEWWQGRVREKE
ncbi:MAG: hypothetical protein ACT4QC_08880 [Planctomycetaceae bacterium]